MSDEQERINTVRIDELSKRMDMVVQYQQREVETAEERLNTRLEGMNQFRTQLTNQAGTFVTKTEFYLGLVSMILAIAAMFIGILMQRH